MDLNVPDTRQSELARRLQSGETVVAQNVAIEFGVSVDTIRRDILALERSGKARRVRGGAVPVAEPAAPMHERLADDPACNRRLVEAAIREIGDAPTIILDGGTTVLGIAENLTPQTGRLVITPSPWAAIACQKKNISVFLLGGTLRPQGGITTGEAAFEQVAGIAADIAVLGACGIEAGFGLSSDDHFESLMKQAMHRAATRTIVVTDSAKVGRRARHRTLPLQDIDKIISDAGAISGHGSSETGKWVVAQ